MLPSEISDTLTNMSIDELAAHVAQASDILARKRESARTAFVEETRKKAESLGISLKDLIAEATGKPSGSGSSTEAKERRKVAIKYRDPDNPENTWTGRGMRPRWLRERLDAGGELETFLISSEHAAA